jgi:plasmid stabilization system protein ParE
LAYIVRYRRRAERDLAKFAECSSLEWFDGLAEAVESLAQFPDRCAFAPESDLRRKGVRQLLYGEGRGIYRIHYSVKDEIIQILTIRHARRQPIGK